MDLTLPRKLGCNSSREALCPQSVYGCISHVHTATLLDTWDTELWGAPTSVLQVEKGRTGREGSCRKVEIGVVCGQNIGTGNMATTAANHRLLTVSFILCLPQSNVDSTGKDRHRSKEHPSSTAIAGKNCSSAQEPGLLGQGRAVRGLPEAQVPSASAYGTPGKLTAPIGLEGLWGRRLEQPTGPSSPDPL